MVKKVFKNKKVYILLFIIVLTIVNFFIFSDSKAVDSQDRIHFIRNEEISSDGIVIESNGHCGLIDTMNPSTSNPISPDNNRENDNGIKVDNYVRSLGCNYLDFLVLTHNHSDHIGGVNDISELINNKTIVFYKEDLTTSDDIEEEQDWSNNSYFESAFNTISSKTRLLCDVSASNKLPSGECYLPNLKNNFINAVDEDLNPFSGYNTNVDYTYYFNFGDYRINLYNLYDNSYHKENQNSIVTLVTHNNSGAKIALMGDLETGVDDYDYPEISDRSNLKPHPAGTCDECKKYGLENQVSDVIGKVDILKAGHHGAGTSNSVYMLSNFQPSYYIMTRELKMKNDLLNHSANAGAISYLYKNYGTMSYYTNQASQADGAIVFQINDSSSNKVTLLNSGLTNMATKIPNGWFTINNLSINDKAYVYYSNSSLVTGWKEIDGHWYYFNDKGVMQEGLIEVDGDVYYLTTLAEKSSEHPHGSMVTGWKKVDDNWYYFNPLSDGHKGAAVTDWFQDEDGYWYYLKKSEDDIYYGPKGSMVTGLNKIFGKTFYLRTYRNEVSEGPTGSMLVSSCKTIDGTEYCFDSDGYLIDKTLNSIKDINLNSNSVLCELNRVTSGTDKTLQMQGVYFFEKNDVPYAVYSGWTDNQSETVLTLVNLSTCSVLDRNNSMVMGNPNDISYNSSDDTYYVTGSDNHNIYSFKINDSNKIVDVNQYITLPDNNTISAFDYDNDNHKIYSYQDKSLYRFRTYLAYIFRDKVADTQTYYTNFKSSLLASQGIAYANDNIYFARTITDASSEFYNHTYVMVYSASTGNYKYSIHINNSSTIGYDGTVEGLTVVGNKLYLGYNVNHTTIKKQGFIVYDGVKDIDDEYEASIKTKVTKPSLSENNYDYTGNNVEPVIDNFDSDKMTISGVSSAIDAGEYNFVISLKNTEEYIWSDGSTDDIEFTWHINKVSMEKPTVMNYNGTYDGQNHGVTISNLGDHEVLYSTDNENFSEQIINRIEAGVTNLYVKFKGDENHIDSESTQATITINKAPLENLTVTGYTGTYDGEEHYVATSVNNYATTYFSTDNENWSTNVPTRRNYGVTNVYVKYVGDNNHIDSEVYNSSITINKADPILLTNILNSDVMKDSEETLLKVTPSIDGTLNISSSDTSVSTVKNTSINVNANEEVDIIVKGITLGSATISIDLVPANNNYNNLHYEQEVNIIEPPKTVVNIPTSNDFCKTNLIYDGSSITITNAPDSGYTFTNNVQTNAGTYTVVAALDDGYIWSNDTITNKEFDCSIGKADLVIPNNNITGFDGLYDNHRHSINVTPVSGSSIKYSIDQLSWTDYNPSRVDVGSTTVYVKYFGDDNHNDSDIYEGVINISKSNLVIPEGSIMNYNGVYDGNAHSIDVDSLEDATTIMYSINNENFTEDKPSYTNAGSYPIYVKYIGDKNHNDSNVYEATVNISKADLIIPHDNINNYNGSYDGNEHSINVNSVDNATIKYSNDGENWSTTKPVYKNAGNYTVYVKYFGNENYNDSSIYEGNVFIAKADASLNVDLINSSIVEGSEEIILKVFSSIDGVLNISTSDSNVFTIKNRTVNLSANSEADVIINAVSVGNANVNLEFIPSNNNYNSIYTNKNISVIEADKTEVAIPNSSNNCADNLVYTGSNLVLTKGTNAGYTLLNTTGVNAGEYTITATLNDGYIWNDDTTTNKTFNCLISKANLDNLEVTSYTGDYDGQSHSVNVASNEFATPMYSSDGESWSEQEITRVDSGVTNLYVKYKGDLNHNDSDVYQVKITINQINPVLYHQQIADQMIEGNDYTFMKFRSSVKGTFEFTSSDTTKFTVSPSSVNANQDQDINVSLNAINTVNGSLSVTFTPDDRVNYKTVSSSYDVIINEKPKIKVAIPTSEFCKDDLKYTGSAQVITKDPLDGYTFSNNIQVYSGTYDITAKLNNGYIWSDDTTGNKTFSCTMTKDDYYMNASDDITFIDTSFFKLSKEMNYQAVKANLNTNGVMSAPKGDAEMAATCDIFTVTYDNATYKYNILLMGDVDKNGSINNSDVNTLFKYIRKKHTLSECQLKAGKLANENDIHINDVAKLYQYINQKIGGLD